MSRWISDEECEQLPRLPANAGYYDNSLSMLCLDVGYILLLILMNASMIRSALSLLGLIIPALQRRGLTTFLKPEGRNDSQCLKEMCADIIKRKNEADSPVQLLINPIRPDFKKSSLIAIVGNTLKTPTILLSPEFLYSADTLPAELSLTQLASNQLTEDEWIFRYEAWLIENFSKTKPEDVKDKFFSSQAQIHERHLHYQLMLRYYQTPKAYNNVRYGMLAHELSHFYHRDDLKQCFFTLIAQLAIFKFSSSNSVALCLSIATFFFQKFAQRLIEKRADSWPATLPINNDINARLGMKQYLYGITVLEQKFFEYYPELQMNPSGVIGRLRSIMHGLTESHPSEEERIQALSNVKAESSNMAIAATP